MTRRLIGAKTEARALMCRRMRRVTTTMCASVPPDGRECTVKVTLTSVPVTRARMVAHARTASTAMRASVTSVTMEITASLVS